MKQGFKFFVCAFLFCICLSSTSLIAASSPGTSLPESTASAEKSTGATQPLPLAIHIMRLLHLTPSEVGSGSSCIIYDGIIRADTKKPSVCDSLNTLEDCSQPCSTVCNTLTTYCSVYSNSNYTNCPSEYSTICNQYCSDVNKYNNQCPAFCGCAQTKCCKSMQSTKAGG